MAELVQHDPEELSLRPHLTAVDHEIARARRLRGRAARLRQPSLRQRVAEAVAVAVDQARHDADVGLGADADGLAVVVDLDERDVGDRRPRVERALDHRLEVEVHHRREVDGAALEEVAARGVGETCARQAPRHRAAGGAERARRAPFAAVRVEGLEARPVRVVRPLEGADLREPVARTGVLGQLAAAAAPATRGVPFDRPAKHGPPPGFDVWRPYRGTNGAE